MFLIKFGVEDGSFVRPVVEEAGHNVTQVQVPSAPGKLILLGPKLYFFFLSCLVEINPELSNPPAPEDQNPQT